ncbi:Ger(x)C family spore germination C-terminal domain-containing protein [Paenibacillus sp. JTLBN-2024]
MWVHPVGAAVLKEGKMVGTLTMKEMRGGLWILGKLKDAEITVQSPTDGKDVSFLIRNTHTRTKPKLTRGRILIQIETDADAGVLSSDSDIDLEDLSYAEARRTKPEPQEIHRRIIGAITKTRSMKTDAFNFSSYIDWTYPRQWETHQTALEEIYAESLAFSVRPDVKIRQIGTIKESVVNTLTPKRRDEQ